MSPGSPCLHSVPPATAGGGGRGRGGVGEAEGFVHCVSDTESSVLVTSMGRSQPLFLLSGPRRLRSSWGRSCRSQTRLPTWSFPTTRSRRSQPRPRSESWVWVRTLQGSCVLPALTQAPHSRAQAPGRRAAWDAPLWAPEPGVSACGRKVINEGPCWKPATPCI